MESEASQITFGDLINLANFGWAIFVGTIAAGVFLFQAGANKRRIRFENTFRLIDRLEAPEMVRLRHAVKALNDRHGGQIDWKKIEAEQNQEVRLQHEAMCSEVSKLFGYAGLLARRGEADTRTLVKGCRGTSSRTMTAYGNIYENGTR